MTPGSDFTGHPAFADGVYRPTQLHHLGCIRAVMPHSARVALAWVWTAILDERAVPFALRALNEMTEDERYTVFSLSRALA